jgi:hypothetical protein
MTAPEVELRGAVYTHLLAKLFTETFSYNGFTIEEAYVPSTDSDSPLLRNGKLFVVAGLADKRGLNRRNTYESRTPVMLLYQKTLTNFRDVSEVTAQVNLIDDLNETLRLEFDYDPYAWERVDFLNDRDHPPIGINPDMLRKGIFEVTAIHQFFRGKA